MHYLIMYRRPRPDFTESATVAEEEAVGRHFQYLQRLLAEGTLMMAGRVDDARFGIGLLDVKDEAEGRRIVEQDPAVSAGVFTAELLPFRLALWPGPDRRS